MKWQRAWSLLVCALAVVWLVMLGCAIRFVVLDIGVSAIYARSGDPYPSVLNARPYAPLGSSALLPGDTLISVNGKDLAGAGPLDFFRRAAAPMLEPGVPVVYERGGVRAETHLPLVSSRLFRASLLVSLTLGASALLLGLRAARTPAIQWGVPAFLIAAIEMAGHPSAAYPFAEMLAPIWLLAVGLEMPLLICTVTYFPDRPGRDLRWVRRLAWIAAVRGPLAASAAYGALLPPIAYGIPLIMATAGLALSAIVGLLTRNYWLSDAIGRRQLRWTVLGVWVAALPTAIMFPIVVANAKHMPLMFDAIGAYAIVPVFLGISILRYNWFDVDRLLSATATYNLLGILVGGVGLVVAPRAGEAAASVLGIDPQTGQTLTAFLLAAAVIPGGRRLRPRIDRLFFPERFAIDSGVDQLLQELPAFESHDTLIQGVGEQLTTLFRTGDCVIYERRDAAFVLVFGETAPDNTRLEAGSPLISAVQRLRRPLATDAGKGRAVEAEHGLFERAALASLRAEVVVPIRGEHEMLGFVALGGKQSGDVYTKTDLALLAALAQTMATEWLRAEGSAPRPARERVEGAASHIFVSHSSKDQTTAMTIAAYLEANGQRCWMAPRDIAAGSSWGEEIVEAIRSSCAMLLVFSARSDASGQVVREVEQAVRREIAIIPVRIEDVPPTAAMDYFLSSTHWFDACTPPFEDHLPGMLAAVRAALSQNRNGERE